MLVLDLALHIPSNASRGLATSIASTGGRYIMVICLAAHNPVPEAGRPSYSVYSALREECFPAFCSSIDLCTNATAAILPNRRPGALLSGSTDRGWTLVAVVWAGAWASIRLSSSPRVPSGQGSDIRKNYMVHMLCMDSL